jgi:hypothetical protein
MTEQLLTVAQAARRRHCSIETVRRAIRAGRLHATRETPNSPYVIRVEWFDQWIDGGLTAAVPRPRGSRVPARRGSLVALERQEEVA